jgi:hypothetical protein
MKQGLSWLIRHFYPQSNGVSERDITVK